MTGLGAGKLRSMRRLADAAGFFTMLAVDQRVPIMGPIEAVHGRVVDAEVTAVKRALLATLAPAASAVLCDPIWAYPFSHDLVAPGQGLVVTLEAHSAEAIAAAVAHGSFAGAGCCCPPQEPPWPPP